MRVPVSLPPPGSRPFDAVGFGLNSIDLVAVVQEYPAPNTKQRLERFAKRPGGQAATAMVACARLGWKTRYVGAFGGDDLGELGQESLRAAGVDISCCRVVAEATSQFAVILVDARSGDRTVLWDRHAGLATDPSAVPLDAVTSGRVLLVDCHETQASTVAARAARAAGIPTVIDIERVRPGIDELLHQIDVIIASQDLPSALTGQRDVGAALRAMADQFGAVVCVVTLGPDGSLAVAGGREIRTSAFEVAAVDTTGAGDVFRGGFIAGWLEAGADAELEWVLRHANAVAGLKCRELGAREGIPSRHEVQAALVGSRLKPAEPMRIPESATRPDR